MLKGDNKPLEANSFENELSAQCSSLMDSVHETNSVAQLQYKSSATINRHNKAQQQHTKDDPLIEHGMCPRVMSSLYWPIHWVYLAADIEHIAKLTSDAYVGYKDPVITYEKDGTVKYHMFECTK